MKMLHFRCNTCGVWGDGFDGFIMHVTELHLKYHPTHEILRWERGHRSEAVKLTDEPDDPPAGWHICDCSEDCGAWEPDNEETAPVSCQRPRKIEVTDDE